MRKRDFYHTGLDVSRSECHHSRLHSVGMYGYSYYLVAAKASTDFFYMSLIERGVAERDIFTSIAVAHAAMTANRNDVLYAFPGAYSTLGAAIWSKDQCHLVGMGTHMSSWYGSGGDVTIYNLETATAAFALSITGSYCQFHGINFLNLGENAACVSAVKDAGRSNHYYHCNFLGHIRSQQAGAALACDLWIDTTVAAAGHDLLLENCYVGSSGCYTRSANNTQLLFGPTGAVAAGSNVTLRNTVFGTRTKTAGCSAIKFAAANTVDRLFLIDNCVFYNFYDANDITSTVTEAINDDCNTTHKILVKGDSVITGYAAWESVRANVYLSGQVCDGDAGIADVES